MAPRTRPDSWYFRAKDSTTALRQRADYVEYLRRYGCENDDYVGAEMIFGELVANAIMHAPGAIEVLVEWPSDRATIYVSDQGPPMNALRFQSSDPFSEHGRGLMIVGRLSPAVTTVSYPGDGKTVSAALQVNLKLARPQRLEG